MLKRIRYNTPGFTIVELIVIISVVTILAAIGIVSYGGWRDSTQKAVVKSDLISAAAAVVDARNFGTAGYPNSIPSTFEESDQVTITGGSQDGGKTFCIDGQSAIDTAIQYYIDNTNQSKGPEEGTCATRSGPATIPNTPTSLVVSSTASTQISLSWTAATGSPSSYIAQCATDPSYLVNMKQASSSTAPVTVTGLNTGILYYCRVKATNINGESDWTTNVTATTVITFGAIAAATALGETSSLGSTSTFVWTGISCSLGTPYYRVVWVNPYAGSATGWTTSLTAVGMTHPQANTNTWKVETKCQYLGVDSSITSSANRSFTSGVDDPVGAFGTIGWDDRWAYNANSNTYNCTSPAVEEYTIVKTLNNATSGTWTYPWSSSTTQSVSSNTNQGARMTVYLQVRCRIGAVVSPSTPSSSSRTDNASVDAPGSVPGWCAGSCGSPRGDRWSAVSCPTGTYAVYWAYAVGDYSNPIWGAYEAANFFGYDRGYYNYGNTMVNGYLMARCTSDYRTSGWGPQGYARY